MRSVSRVEEVSINTVYKLLVEAGAASLAIHDETVRNVKASRIQCGEIWSFCHAKQENVATAKAAPEGANDVWTWTALDADTKLIVSYYVGDRGSGSAIELMDDLRESLSNRVQLATDGHRAYLEAVEKAFGGGVDYITSAAFARRLVCRLLWQRASPIGFGRWRISWRRSTRWRRCPRSADLTRSGRRRREHGCSDRDRGRRWSAGLDLPLA